MKTETLTPQKVAKDTTKKLQKKLRKLAKQQKKNDRKLGKRQQQVSVLEGKQARLTAKRDALEEELTSLAGDDLGEQIERANRTTEQKRPSRRAS